MRSQNGSFCNILYNVPAGMTKAQPFEMFELGEGETLINGRSV